MSNTYYENKGLMLTATARRAKKALELNVKGLYIILSKKEIKELRKALKMRLTGKVTATNNVKFKIKEN